MNVAIIVHNNVAYHCSYIFPPEKYDESPFNVFVIISISYVADRFNILLWMEKCERDPNK